MRTFDIDLATVFAGAFAVQLFATAKVIGHRSSDWKKLLVPVTALIACAFMFATCWVDLNSGNGEPLTALFAWGVAFMAISSFARLNRQEPT